MHVLMADGELVEIPRGLVGGAAERVLLTRQHVRQVPERAGAVGQIELPARGMCDRARIPQPVAAFDQGGAAVGMAQRPVFVEPADMADLPEHGIDDVEPRAHQFGR